MLNFEWTIKELGEKTPQQSDDNQCGVFVCITMLFLLSGRELDFSCDDIMTKGRKHISQSIKKNRLLFIKPKKLENE